MKKEYEKKEAGCAERKTLYMCDTINRKQEVVE
jgi:hypothetical protein